VSSKHYLPIRHLSGTIVSLGEQSRTRLLLSSRRLRRGRRAGSEKADVSPGSCLHEHYAFGVRPAIRQLAASQVKQQAATATSAKEPPQQSCLLQQAYPEVSLFDGRAQPLSLHWSCTLVWSAASCLTAAQGPAIILHAHVVAGPSSSMFLRLLPEVVQGAWVATRATGAAGVVGVVMGAVARVEKAAARAASSRRRVGCGRAGQTVSLLIPSFPSRSF
jgi:hypothetical protein